jgi:hypothetical protein
LNVQFSLRSTVHHAFNSNLLFANTKSNALVWY